jgi:hypothetical protein
MPVFPVRSPIQINDNNVIFPQLQISTYRSNKVVISASLRSPPPNSEHARTRKYIHAVQIRQHLISRLSTTIIASAITSTRRPAIHISNCRTRSCVRCRITYCVRTAHRTCVLTDLPTDGKLSGAPLLLAAASSVRKSRFHAYKYKAKKTTAGDELLVEKHARASLLAYPPSIAEYL